MVPAAFGGRTRPVLPSGARRGPIARQVSRKGNLQVCICRLGGSRRRCRGRGREWRAPWRCPKRERARGLCRRRRGSGPQLSGDGARVARRVAERSESSCDWRLVDGRRPSPSSAQPPPGPRPGRPAHPGGRSGAGGAASGQLEMDAGITTSWRTGRSAPRSAPGGRHGKPRPRTGGATPGET
jgi:hypothetical protein